MHFIILAPKMTQKNYGLLITRIFSAFSFVFVCAFLFDPGPGFCFCLSSHRSQLVTTTLLLVLCPVQPPTQILPQGFGMQILTSYAQCCGRCSICHRLRLCRRPCVRRAWPQATWTCGCLDGHERMHIHTTTSYYYIADAQMGPGVLTKRTRSFEHDGHFYSLNVN